MLVYFIETNHIKQFFQALHAQIVKNVLFLQTSFQMQTCFLNEDINLSIMC
jgi:hypothetical protein